MTTIPMYHEGSRQLQDRFQTRALADRLVEKLARNAFTDEDRAFIESRALFFIATADEQGQPDCSYKGGLPGFVRVVDAHTLAFPSYDGNGMFKSLGNVIVNPQVGILFIDFESPKRLRVNGRASMRQDDPLLAQFVGAQLIVRVQAEAIFPNCPRYIPNMQMTGPSIYTPQPKCEAPEPAWKTFDSFKAVVHPRAPTWKG